MKFWRVEVEWMDGEKRSYDVGGYSRRPIDASDGTLVLRMGNNAYANDSDHVATIPLANIREYKAVER